MSLVALGLETGGLSIQGEENSLQNEMKGMEEVQRGGGCLISDVIQGPLPLKPKIPLCATPRFSKIIPWISEVAKKSVSARTGPIVEGTLGRMALAKSLEITIQVTSRTSGHESLVTPLSVRRGCSQSERQVTKFFSCSEECGEVFGDKC